MEFELWYLILVPVLFAAGWIAKSFDAKEHKTPQNETQSLYKGLDLLLNNQPDKAIDSFIELVKLDPETIELHYSLGTLFRRRGEFDRAVRIHNHLLNRADLPTTERSRALSELAEDYLKAGLLDRAEHSFVRLSEGKSEYRFDALRKLIQIYETEREWLKAIATAKELEEAAGENHPTRVAHFYCEIADQALRKGATDDASTALEQALQVDPRSKRALITKGQLLAKTGDFTSAINLWHRVAEISPEHEALVVIPIAQALEALGKKEEAVAYLERVAEQGTSIDELDAAASLISKWKTPQEAMALIQSRLELQPSLMGFQRLIELSATQQPENEQIKQLSTLLKAQTDKISRYRCKSCGFMTRKYQWQCPGCNQWDSFPAVRTEEVMAK